MIFKLLHLKTLNGIHLSITSSCETMFQIFTDLSQSFVVKKVSVRPPNNGGGGGGGVNQNQFSYF